MARLSVSRSLSEATGTDGVAGIGWHKGSLRGEGPRQHAAAAQMSKEALFGIDL